MVIARYLNLTCERDNTDSYLCRNLAAVDSLVCLHRLSSSRVGSTSSAELAQPQRGGSGLFRVATWQSLPLQQRFWSSGNGYALRVTQERFLLVQICYMNASWLQQSDLSASRSLAIPATRCKTKQNKTRWRIEVHIDVFALRTLIYHCDWIRYNLGSKFDFIRFFDNKKIFEVQNTIF